MGVSSESVTIHRESPSLEAVAFPVEPGQLGGGHLVRMQLSALAFAVLGLWRWGCSPYWRNISQATAQAITRSSLVPSWPRGDGFVVRLTNVPISPRSSAGRIREDPLPQALLQVGDHLWAGLRVDRKPERLVLLLVGA